MNGPTWMREPVLQGAAAALDPASARRAIESALFDGVPGSEIGPCEVERVRYAPREKLQVTYRFEVVRHDTGTRTVQRASARLYPVGESSRRYRRARVNARSHAGRALGHVPEMGMVLWGFPNDRKLESIARLLDSTWLETKALPALPTVTSAGRCQPELVRYVSEHTCTVRVAVPTKQD
ncbi:MAG: hypothetical protein ACE5GC_08635, partial [Acidimicrobiia bacterium]